MELPGVPKKGLRNIRTSHYSIRLISVLSRVDFDRNMRLYLAWGQKLNFSNAPERVVRGQPNVSLDQN
jgi:hypothetical protein